MANKIVFDYTQMQTAVTSIKNLATQYQTAAQTLQSALTTATANWTGDSKDAFMNFVTGPINKHTATDVPAMVNAIATLLDNNAQSMQQADKQVANNMPSNL